MQQVFLDNQMSLFSKELSKLTFNFAQVMNKICSGKSKARIVNKT